VADFRLLAGPGIQLADRQCQALALAGRITGGEQQAANLAELPFGVADLLLHQTAVAMTDLEPFVSAGQAGQYQPKDNDRAADHA
jgi:hypothetical protein